MHLVRYEYGGAIHHGILEGDRIEALAGDFFGDLARTGASVDLADVTLKAPTAPSKIVNMAINYGSHATGFSVPTRPQPFLAPPSSVLDPGGVIRIYDGSTTTEYEGEMGVVIGTRCRMVAEADVRGHILGVCAANDVSEREWQLGDDKDVQWWRGKGADTFSPFGPWITTGLDYNDLHLQTRLNGETVQDARTSELIFGVDVIVSFVSRYMTLEPGDVLFTGTPGTPTAMKPGDVVEVELEACGVLRNPVAAA